MWKYDTLICFFWQMKRRSLAGQGFASSYLGFLVVFGMSRQSK